MRVHEFEIVMCEDEIEYYAHHMGQRTCFVSLTSNGKLSARGWMK